MTKNLIVSRRTNRALACCYMLAIAGAAYAPSLSATVLTYDFTVTDYSCSAACIPDGYGDRVATISDDLNEFYYGLGNALTPNVIVDYENVDAAQVPVSLWTSGYGDLVNALGHASFNVPVEMVLTPDPGHAIRFNSFQIASWGNTPYQTRISIFDEVGSRSTPNLFDSDLLIQGATAFTPMATPVYGDGSVRLYVSNIGSTGLDNVNFDQVPTIPFALGMADTNSDGSADIAVIRGRPVRAEIRSGLDGALLNTVAFLDDDTIALNAESLPDTDGNGVAEILVLGARKTDGRLVAEVRNISSPSLRRRITFAPDFAYVAMSVTPNDISGNGVPELAVLGTDTDRRPWVQVKDLMTGDLVGKARFEPAYLPFALHVIEDLNSSMVAELAVFGVDAVGRVRAQVKDVVTAQLAAKVYFDRNFRPSWSAGLDIDGDGELDSLAVLGEDAGGVVRAQLKDVASGTRLSSVRFQSGFTAEALIVVPDLNESGAPELAVLQKQGDTVRVQIKDALSGQPIKVVPLSSSHQPVDLGVAPDLNGNGKPELVYLGEDASGGQLLQVKDALTGTLIFSTTLP